MNKVLAVGVTLAGLTSFLWLHALGFDGGVLTLLSGIVGFICGSIGCTLWLSED